MLASLFLYLIAGACAILLSAAYSHRHVPAAAPLNLLLIALGIWSFAYGVELQIDGLAAKLLCAKIEYIGIVTIPAAWFIFALEYGNHLRADLRRFLPLLLIEPAFTLGLIWTNDQHTLFYRTADLTNNATLGATLHVTYGPGFWIHASYAYLLLLISTLILARLLVRAPKSQRRTIGLVLFGAMVPWIGNAAYLSGASQIDLTPFAFLISASIFAWSIFRLRLLELIPIARDTLVERMSDGVLVLDTTGQIIDLNPATLRLIGRARQHAIGQRIGELLPEHADIIGRFREYRLTHDEVQIHDANGVARWLDIRLTPLCDGAGRQSGNLIVLRDISEQKQTEAALREAKDSAEVASRAKSAFLAHVSHELRTPLTAIIGYSELLQREAQQIEREDFSHDLRRISDSGQHLLAMIRDVLDLTQMESGSVELFVEPIQLNSLIIDIQLAAEPLMAQHANRFTIDCPPVIGVLISDVAKLRRMLLHLLSNAAKFTDHGEVTLKIWRSQRHPGQNKPAVCFEVSDTGIGFSADQVEHLFEPLHPNQATVLPHRVGLKVGLAIVRQLCDLVRGQITAESQAGQGARFTLTIPDLID